MLENCIYEIYFNIGITPRKKLKLKLFPPMLDYKFTDIKIGFACADKLIETNKAKKI